VSGTATNTTGNVDAVVVKYSHNGNYQWIKTVHKGVLDHTVDCDIDNTNGDVYLLQNAFVNTDKIYVTRFNAAGDLKWTKVYSANDTISTATIGKNIHVDPNPGGGGCEIYVAGQREVYGSDPHGHVDGLNIIAFKYNRSGVRTVFYSPGLAGSIAPLISNTKSVYYSNYQGHPNLFIIGDGDYSNPTPGTYGWKLISFNINSTARMQSDAEMTSAVQNLKLYPNPASENVTLIADDQMETIQLYNTSGQLVKEIKGSTEYASFSVDDLPNGYYVVKVISKTVVSFTSLVVN
jgi:hypothetical protein